MFIALTPVQICDRKFIFEEKKGNCTETEMKIYANDSSLKC
jgi:hypothetical protein